MSLYDSYKKNQNDCHQCPSEPKGASFQTIHCEFVMGPVDRFGARVMCMYGKGLDGKTNLGADTDIVATAPCSRSYVPVTHLSLALISTVTHLIEIFKKRCRLIVPIDV